MTFVLCDLEGCLSDHTERLHTLFETTQADPKDREAWKIYYKGLPQDEPRQNMIDAARAWIDAGDRVVIYSTRFQNKYEHEKEWLTTHGLWGGVELLQRGNSERKTKGPALVAMWAGAMQPDILVDDRVEVRDLIAVTSPKIKVYGPGDFQGPTQERIP